MFVASKTAMDAMWDWNITDGKVEWFGDIDTMLGYDTGEFPRTIEAWKKAIHPDDHDRVLAAVDQHLHAQTPYIEEYRVVLKNSGLRYWTDRGIALRDGGGAAIRMIGACTDITERKQSEKTLKESEEKYHALLDHAVDGIIISDLEGTFLEANQKMVELLGLSREELLGMKFTDIHPKEELERVMGVFQAMVERKAYSCNDTRVLRKDGRIVPVDITGTLIEYAGKKVMQGIFRDITERKQAEETLRKIYDELEFRVQERTVQLSEAYKALQREMEERKRAEDRLRQTQKMKAIGTLAGGIAHDFNNILAGIMGFTEMVMDDTDPASPEYRRLELALKGAHRGRDLVRQILTFSRQAEYEQKPVALGDIVEEGLKLMRPLLPATTQIRSTLPSGGDTVMADPAQMHQVLMNLCTNGIQAMGKRGGVLEISVAREHVRKDGRTTASGMRPGDYATLTVRDTGCGMGPETVERIFDPFFTTKAHGEGTGLGLSVVHGIVKSHGGFIRVESEPGKGSSFSIYLPRIERHEAAADEESSATGGRECILFVDDEDLLVELNNERLSQLGYDVVGTTSSLEALKVFRKEPWRFNLVITDYTMPDMTGVELARRLLQARSDIPIILCTGYNDDISPEKAKKAGIREFLLKPQSKRELDQAIRRILDGKTE
ncbi:MAG: PAS domain S-box protein [Syntrophorhabdaceae bacterium]|nr:PAS domain S-box protein [Syntrophorhabdaceae bacterium]